MSLQKDANTDLSRLLQTKPLMNPAIVHGANNNPPVSSYDQVLMNGDDLSWPVPSHTNDVTKYSVKPYSISQPEVIGPPPVNTSGANKVPVSKMSRLLSQEKKPGLNSSLTVDRVVNSTGVTSGHTVSSSTHVVVSTNVSVFSNRSGAVRQLFTGSTASSYRSTSTVSTVGTKMSTTATKSVLTTVAVQPVSMPRPPDPIPAKVTPVLQRVPNNKSNNFESTPQTEKIVRTTVASASAIKTVTVSTGTNNMTSSSTSGNNDQQSQNVFEQIMKTPSIFQEAASQIAQPKKYSDAVGKKSNSFDSGTHSGGSKMSYSGVMGGVTSVSNVPNNEGGTNTGQSKINLAPGTRPIGSESSSKVRQETLSTHLSKITFNLHVIFDIITCECHLFSYSKLFLLSPHHQLDLFPLNNSDQEAVHGAIHLILILHLNQKLETLKLVVDLHLVPIFLVQLVHLLVTPNHQLLYHPKPNRALHNNVSNHRQHQGVHY